ncbi:hypothetical protein BCR44DRAFT_1445864, partial [Catenaria anguillulae PL171]
MLRTFSRPKSLRSQFELRGLQLQSVTFKTYFCTLENLGFLFRIVILLLCDILCVWELVVNQRSHNRREKNAPIE